MTMSSDAPSGRWVSLEWIGNAAHGGPSVLLFEDLHWIDGASAAALERLIETVPATRTFLLLNFRPEYHAA